MATRIADLNRHDYTPRSTHRETVVSRIKIIVLVAGIALGYYGFKQWRLAGETKEEPQTITCKALGENGYGDNAYVKLTDFMVSPARMPRPPE